MSRMKPLITEDDQNIINNFDTMIWSIVEEDKGDRIEVSCVKQAFKSDRNVKPTDLGHKYCICLFKDNDDAEITNAIIGDPDEYISRLARLGYHGMMIKDKTVSAATSKKMLKVMLSTSGFNDNSIRSILKGV
jgi:hypothetical protein